MTRFTKRESSLSRNDRHFPNSTVSNILARSRGFESSVHESKHAGAGRTDKGCERARRDIGHQPQRLDVVRMVRPLVVADQRSVRFATRRAELVLVDLLEELTLVELDGPGQVAAQLAL